MTKICFPHYQRDEFATLADALEFLNRISHSILGYTLCDIVQYNTCYRDHLQSHGIEDLIIRLIEEAPQLKEEKVLLDHLREWAREEKLADYNIQCYNINDKVTILGHTFNGLNDIKKHTELYGHGRYDSLHCLSRSEVETYSDVHIGHIYEKYPIFDSSDLCDDRTYQNYIFRTTPITESEIKEAFHTFHGFNFCMVHEQIPENILPILYYRGDGKYMLLASKQ